MATATTIQQGVHPLLVTWFIIGFGVYPLNQPKPCLSALYSLTLWCVYGYLYYYILMFFTWDMIFRRTVLIIVHGINLLTALLSVIISLCYDKKLKTCMKKLAAVDDTLEELGIPKMYQEIHTRSKRTVIGWIMYIFILNIYDSFWWLDTRHSRLVYLIPQVLNHSFHANLLTDLVFIIFMWHLQLELCRIARELNLIFGTQMTLEMLIYILSLTVVAFYTCIMLLVRKDMETKYWIGNSIQGCTFIMRLCSINYVCERVSVKANKINETIHRLTIILRYADIRQEICQFILQAIHHPLKFTGLGLFRFGDKLLWKFCAMITTFVMLAVQWSPELQEYNELRSKMNNDTDASMRDI